MSVPLMEQDNPEKETGHLEERTITEKVRVKKVGSKMLGIL